MASLDISSVFITADLLNQLYGELDINTNAEPVHLIKDPFNFIHRSPNQITTIKTKDDQHRVLSYDSAQNYYKSEKARLMKGPELAEVVRLSTNPETDGWIPDEDFLNHVEAWDRIKIDVAFKANWLKYRQNKDLAYELLLSGNRPIVGSGSQRDASWGVITAKILMIIREDLRRRATY